MSPYMVPQETAIVFVELWKLHISKKWSLAAELQPMCLFVEGEKFEDGLIIHLYVWVCV